jgi:23S rRNA pseudouridine1911/1915/1917 synthase
LAERILYRSGRFIVVNKLIGEASEEAPGMTGLPGLLRKFSGGGPWFAVNRLDVPVSGCALFAQTGEALAHAHGQFRRGLVEKRYWAITEMPEDPAAIPERGELIHWIAEDSRHNRSRAFDEKAPGRKRAELRYRMADRGENSLFLEIELVTGRRHQIRAQLETLGLHIRGDLKYGARRSEKKGGIRLHAYSLGFFDAAPVRAAAPPPLMDRLWEAAADALIPK